MTRHKINDLDGPLLDAAVAMAEGHNFRIYSDADSPIGRALTIAWRAHYTQGDADEFEASSDWAVGGPIIERERIKLDPNNPPNQDGAGKSDWLASFGLAAPAR